MSKTSEDFLKKRPELKYLDKTSERFLTTATLMGSPLSYFFRFQIKGWENIPDQACLLVANHSVAAWHEILLLLFAWRKRHPGRKVRGLLHRIAWQYPFRLFPFFPKLGGVYAHPDVACKQLAKGRSLLIFPGGDIEGLRPFQKRYKILFSGRFGFANIAKEANVCTVPIVICGSHAAYFVLPGAQTFAHIFGLKRIFGFKAFPLTLGILLFVLSFIAALFLPILWPLAGLLFLQALLPFPTKITASILPAMEQSPEQSTYEFAKAVEQVMQKEMDRLSALRSTPFG